MDTSPSPSSSNAIDLCASTDVSQDDDSLELFPVEPSSSASQVSPSRDGNFPSDVPPERAVNEPTTSFPTDNVEALFSSRKIKIAEKKSFSTICTNV